MIFTETPLRGAIVITLEPFHDERGSFARTFCRKEFEAHGLSPAIAQCNVSRNAKCGTLRGLHFQVSPYQEAKLVRCTRGALWDVIVDLRAGSDTRGQWYGVELSETNATQLFIPEGFAHGFQTLSDDTEIFYQISNFFAPEAARGLRYDDPALKIDWPLPVSSISDKDQSWPDFSF
jgi:dTDP-4-dehydrorhamnose 3,5-epimerase